MSNENYLSDAPIKPNQMTFVKAGLRLSPEKVFQEEDPTIVVSSPAWRPSNVFGTFWHFLYLHTFITLFDFTIWNFWHLYLHSLFLLFGTFCTCILLLLFWNSLLLFPQQVGDQLLSFPRSHVSWFEILIQIPHFSIAKHCNALFHSLTFPSPRFPTY